MNLWQIGGELGSGMASKEISEFRNSSRGIRGRVKYEKYCWSDAKMWFRNDCSVMNS